MYDVECPYCGLEQEVYHDNGYGLDEDGCYQQECDNCEKVFAYTTSIHITHEARAAKCLNGGEHNWRHGYRVPRDEWPDAKRCKDCGFEDPGRHVWPNTA